MIIYAQVWFFPIIKTYDEFYIKILNIFTKPKKKKLTFKILKKNSKTPDLFKFYHVLKVPLKAFSGNFNFSELFFTKL